MINLDLRGKENLARAKRCISEHFDGLFGGKDRVLGCFSLISSFLFLIITGLGYLVWEYC